MHKVDILGLQGTQHEHDWHGNGYRIVANKHVGFMWNIAHQPEELQLDDRIAVMRWQSLVVICGYAPFVKNDLQEEFWENLTECTMKWNLRQDVQITVVGDFNAHIDPADMRRHHRVCDTIQAKCDTDEQGWALLHYANSSRLKIRNLQDSGLYAQKITYPSTGQNGGTIVDYIMTQENLLFSGMTVRTPAYISDHRLLIAKIKLSRTIKRGRPFKEKERTQQQPAENNQDTTLATIHQIAASQWTKHIIPRRITTDSTELERQAQQLHHKFRRKGIWTEAMKYEYSNIRAQRRQEQKHRDDDFIKEVSKHLHRNDLHAAYKALAPWTKRGVRKRRFCPLPEIQKIVRNFKDLLTKNARSVWPIRQVVQRPQPWIGQSKIHLYTDGSWDQQNKIGYAVYNPLTQQVIRSGATHDQASSTRAEALAILMAIQIEKGVAYSIDTDSANCIANLRNLRKLIGSNFSTCVDGDIWRQIAVEISEGTHLTLNKVRAHSGIAGNEICDVHAKIGLQQQRTTMQNVNDDTTTADTPAYTPRIHQNPHIVLLPCDDTTPTRDEIISAINRLSNHKAKGPDGIVAEQLKKEENVEKIVQMIQDIWNSNTVPMIWKQIRMCIVDKPDGGVRGIAITAVSAKIMTRIIADRMADIPFLDNQFGFRPGRNTTIAIAVLKKRIHQRLHVGKEVTVIFLDIKKAYDSVARNQLSDLLKSYGLGPTAINLILQLYNDEITVEIENEQAIFNSTIGVRQGCVLSPIIFTMIMNECIGKVQLLYPHVMILGYADDVAVIADKTEDAIAATEALTDAYAMFGMELNMTKTEAVIYTDQIMRDSTTGYFSRLHKLGITNRTALDAEPSRFSGTNNKYLVVPRAIVAIACPCQDCPYVAHAQKRTKPQTLIHQHVQRTHKNIAPNVEMIRLVTTRAGNTEDPRHDKQPQPPTQLTVNGQQINVMKSFKYLGVYMTSTFSDTTDISARIQAATKAHGRLWKLWSSKKATRHLKTQVFKAIIMPVLMYAAGTWMVTQAQTRMLTSTYHKLARRTGGFKGTQEEDGTWRKMSATRVRELLRLPSMSDMLCEARLRLVGQIARLKSPIGNTALTSCQHGRRGMITGCWSDLIEQDLRDKNLTLEDANHRGKWEVAIRAVLPPPNQE